MIERVKHLFSRRLSPAAGLAIVLILAIACTPAPPAAPTTAPQGAAPTTAPAAPAATQAPAPTAVAGARATPGGVARDGIVVGSRVDATTMDPYNSPDELTGGGLNKLIYENLVWVEIDSAGQLQYQPLLATSWTKLQPTVWEVKLREGVTFHDGSPFSAEDVKFTFDRYLNDNATTGNSWAVSDAWFDSVRVMDGSTVQFTTKYEMSDLFAWLAYAPKIVSKTAVERAGQVDAQELSGPALVGTGKFRLVERVRGERIVLERFDGYWGERANVRTVRWVPIPDDSTRVAALQTGAVDLITSVPPALMDQLQGRQGIEVRNTPSARYVYIWLNNLKPPFDNPKVREAANYAVDVQAISDSLFRGTATKADAPMAPSNFGYAPQTGYNYDPARARQLLQEAGVQLPVRVTFWTPQARYLQDREVATAVQGYMNQAGFQVDLQAMEWGTLSQRMFAQQQEYKNGQIPAPEHDMLLLSWASITLDGDYALYKIFHSGEAYNLAYYQNPQVDQMLERARVSTDQEERRQIYNQVQGQVMADAPQIFLYYEPQILAMKTDLKDVKVLPFEHYLLHDAHW